MTTTPTNNPIPSEAPQDLKFNAGKIDEFVTSMGWTYTDRFGVKRYTIEGMNHLAQLSISAFGYITIDSFQAGASITLPNQALRDTSTGEYYRWDGALPKTVSAGSTPTSSGGVGAGAWLSVGDATLRGNLASGSVGLGDALIDVTQPYAGAISTTQHEVNKRLVNILDFGGKGDGVTDNATALQNASAAVGEWGTIYLPALGGLNYKFGNTTSVAWTNNRIIKADESVMLTFADAGYINPTAKFASKVLLRFSNISANYTYPNSLYKDKADRPVWVGRNDIDFSTVRRVFPSTGDLSLGMYYRQFDQTNETVTTITPTATSESGYVIANTDVNKQSIGFASIADGEEISCYFDSPSSSTTVNAIVMINCTLGRLWYSCVASNSSNPTKSFKTAGGSVVSGTIAYQGMDTTPAYKFFASDVTIRRNSSRNATIMLNGFSIDTVDVSSLGEIADIGFGVGGSGSITISGITRRLNATRDVGRFFHVCCFGDSISADSLGSSWPSVLGTSFDGMNGIRLANVDNYAHAGDDSTAQRAVMNSVNLGNYNLCLIMVGVNDIQGMVTASTYLSNMRSMISNAISNGNQVIVSSPTIYYGQAQVSGVGQPTTNSDYGKYHRAGLRNLCAELGAKFIEMNQVIGPVLPDYITDGSLSKKDSTVSDNIHPTSNTSYLFARSFYNAIVGLASPYTKLDLPFTEISGTPGANWASPGGNDTPKWSRDSNGTITLDGVVNYTGGTAPVNGAVAYTLPAGVRPRFTTRQVAWADAVTARVLIDPNGQVQVYGMTSGSWLSLSGISFKGVV